MASKGKLRLGDACRKIGSGATPRGGKQAYLGGDFTLVRSQNIYNEGFEHQGLVFIDAEQAAALSNVEVEKDDVLLNITGDSVARCCQIDPEVLPARVNQHVAILRTKPDQLDARFLRYKLVSPEMQQHLLAIASAGGTRNALTKGCLEDLEIEAPPLPEQQAIAGLLGSLDDKIRLNRRISQTLESIAECIYAETFLNTSEWETKRLDDVASVSIGRTPPRKEPHWFSEDDTGIPWVSIRDMGKAGLYIVETAERLTHEAVRKFNVRLIPRGTVILSFKLTVGRVALAGFDLTTNEAIAHLPLDDGSGLCTEYLYFALKRFPYDTLASTSSIATAVNSSTIRAIPIAVPPPDLVREFQTSVLPIFQMIDRTIQQSRTLADLRNALLPKMLSGEIRLRRDA